MKYIAIILILFSCSTPEKLVNKALSKDRAKVAEITRAEFPCVDIKADTLYKTDTTFDWIEVNTPNDYEQGKDTIIQNNIYQPTRTIHKTAYITKKVEDSAKIYLLGAQMDSMKGKHEKQLADSSAAIKKRDAEIVKLEGKIEKQKKAIRILLIPWILIVLYVVYRIIKRK
jgi:ketopantoate hydroxymethyltransferase